MSARRSFLTLLTLLTFIWLLCGCTLWSEPKHATWKSTTSVEEYERLYWQAMKEKDWQNVESHTASNYTHAGPSGVMGKDDALKFLKESTLDDYSLGDFQVTQSGDTWVVTYTANYSYTYQGKSSGPQSMRQMSIWQQQKSGFVLIASVDVGK
jgi:hypothetical protein